MIQEFSFVLLYISFFGLSDLLIKYLGIKTDYHKLIYYATLFILSSILYFLFTPLIIFSHTIL